MLLKVFLVVIISLVDPTLAQYEVVGHRYTSQLLNCRNDLTSDTLTYKYWDHRETYFRWRKNGDPNELIQVTNTTTLTLRKSLFMVSKVDSYCTYSGYAGPAISLGVDNFFISSIFTLAELARDSCKHPLWHPRAVSCWNTQPNYARIDMRLPPNRFEIPPGYDHPNNHPRLVGRIDITELAVYRFDSQWNNLEDEIKSDRETGPYEDCYAHSYNYLFKDNYYLMAQVKHRVFVEPYSGYREFMLVTDDFLHSNASVCGFHNRGSPIICKDKLALITVPDGSDEACSSSRQVRGIPMWFIMESIKNMSSEGEELYRRIIAKQESIVITKKNGPYPVMVGWKK